MSAAETMSPAEAAELLHTAARGLDGAAVQVGSGRPISVRLGWQRAAAAVTAVADALPVETEPVPSLADAPVGTIAYVAEAARVADSGGMGVDVVRVSTNPMPDALVWAEVDAAEDGWWNTAALVEAGAVISHLPAKVAHA